MTDLCWQLSVVRACFKKCVNKGRPPVATKKVAGGDYLYKTFASNNSLMNISRQHWVFLKIYGWC